MKKRALICGGTAIAFVVLIVAVVAIDAWQDRPGVTKKNYDRIEKGMSREQVQAILGTKSSVSSIFVSGGGVWTIETWSGEDGAAARLTFICNVDGLDKLSTKDWTASTETAWQTVLRWMHLRKSYALR